MTAARDALVEASGRRLTWADLDREVGRVATGLGDVGMVAGQRVLLVLGNRIELVTTYLGALRAQLVAVPVNPRAKVEELAWMIADSGARLVVADSATVADARAAGVLVRAALAGERDVLDDDVVDPRPRAEAGGGRLRAPAGGADELAFDAVRAAEPRPLTARPDPETLASLLYTGSTTDLPRAAMLTHRALLANVEQTAAVRPVEGLAMIGTGDVVLGVLPLFHVYGLNAVLGSVLRHGATLVLTDHFDPRGTLEVVAEHGVTVVPVAPAVFPHWLGLDGLAEAMSGGAPGAVGIGAAGPVGDRGVHGRHRRPGPPGLRPDRGGSGRHQHAGLASRSRAAARWAPRCPAWGCAWSTTTGWSPSRETPARSRSGAATCSAATGPMRPTARCRRLVVDR